MQLLSATVFLAGLLCIRGVPVQDPSSDDPNNAPDSQPDAAPDLQAEPQEPAPPARAPPGVLAQGDAQSSGSVSDDSEQAAPEQKSSAMGRSSVTSPKAAPSDVNPLVAADSQSDSVGTLPYKQPGSDSISLEKPDNIANYLQGIHRQGLRMTVDSVDEGYKKKNKNSYQDASIKIKNKNSTNFNRNGQVQNFEGPGFNMRTALLTESTDGKTKTLVITQSDKEKNFTRNKDRMTQFVGTLNTDQFSSGALLTDHSNRGVSGSFRQTNDGNRETRISKQSKDSQTRGSFLKAANLSINARYQSDSYSNRARQISDIVLGGSDDLSDSGTSGGASSSGDASAGDGQDGDQEESETVQAQPAAQPLQTNFG